MPKGEPYIPETITVHLGRPDADAMNVEVPFADYIKNVASSEIYPTWPEAALRANIYAIITFALNRIYTEWYRSRGYPFDITDSTQYDQKYTYGREVFENINRLVDEQLNTYIRRQGTIEPLFAAFCNGTTVTCEGLSQWGTVGLAEQGYSPYDSDLLLWGFHRLGTECSGANIYAVLSGIPVGTGIQRKRCSHAANSAEPHQPELSGNSKNRRNYG